MSAPGLRVDVLTSGIWQTNSVVLARGGRCLVIDPAYFPRELEAVAACAAAAGTVEAVVFSHGHWDHVMGHAAFSGVPVWLAAGLDADITAGSPRAAAYLADAREVTDRSSGEPIAGTLALRLATGDFRARLFSPVTGARSDEVKLSREGDVAVLDLPEFQHDVVVEIRRVE